MLYCEFSVECDGERILKFGQYLMKLWQKLGGVFFGSSCIFQVMRQKSSQQQAIRRTKSVSMQTTCGLNCFANGARVVDSRNSMRTGNNLVTCITGTSSRNNSLQ